MSTFDHQWQKLTAAARRADEGRGDAAPFGFAVRVSTRAMALPADRGWGFLGRFALRGLLVASVCGVSAAAFHWSTTGSDQGDDYASVDSIDELLELS